MPLDLQQLSEKIKKYREQLGLSLDELSRLSGIAPEMLKAIESAKLSPSGDQILIFSDVFKCDYNYFISNQRLAPFEETETLYRRYGNDFSKDDRWVVQEFLFLCECEEFLIEQLKIERKFFEYTKTSQMHKTNGINAAEALREFLGYQSNEVRIDIYDDFRKIGLHVFRRKLKNSNISGLFIQHPKAGKCILVNYDEDVYRQRFTLSHEVCHSILDVDEELVVSKKGDQDYRETGANYFASHYLIPRTFSSLFSKIKWNREDIVKWSNKLHVSAHALAIALKDMGCIDETELEQYKKVVTPQELKLDAELPNSLSPGPFARKKELLQRGLSDAYTKLCFDAYEKRIITASRLAEMLLTDESELISIVELCGRSLKHEA